MPFKDPEFTVGIEEEYLLVDRQSRDLVVDPPPELIKECQTALGSTTGQVSPEFLRSQIEVGTRVCRNIKDARHVLSDLRITLSRITEAHGMAIVAASTHPFAKWSRQAHTDRERYNVLAEDFQVVARRLLICGMHVHAGIADDALRIDLLNQASYFLPHLLAFSTSSPFWQGEVTGLKSYRLSVFDELPRTGMPPQFDSFAEYERTVSVMVNAGLIEDGTKIWWDLRPSARFPTLEMRIADVCPLIEDALTVASLYLCVCRMLYRLRRQNLRWRAYSSFLLTENRWRAQRYGIEKGLIDFGKGEIVDFADLTEELLELIREDAEALDVVAEVEHARTILARGTSADRQLALFRKLRENDVSKDAALQTIVDALIDETTRGLPSRPASGAAIATA